MRDRISVVDLAWGYCAQLLNLAAGILLLPVMSRHLPPEALGLWMVFITLVSLSQLIELGLQPTLARSVAYACAGMKDMRSRGLGTLNELATANRASLLSLQRAGMFVYRYAALLTSVLLLGAGTVYIEWVLQKHNGIEIKHARIAWALYCAGTILNTYFGYYTAFIQGHGEVTRGNQVVVASKLLFLLLGAAFVINGNGLLGLGIASLSSAIAGRLLAMRFYVRNKVSAHEANSNLTPTWKMLVPNALRLAAVQLGAFLILRASVLIGANYISLSEVGSYGITVQVLVTLCGLGSLMLNLQMPKMNACQARGDKQALRRLLGSAVLLSWLVYWSGAAFLIIVGNQILTALGKGTPLLPIAQLTALTIIFFLEMNHSVFAAYLTTLNEVPFMGAAIASGVLTVVLATLLCGTVGLGVWGLVVAQGTVQAAYNNWKWPREALHDVGASLWSLICMASMAMFRLRSR